MLLTIRTTHRPATDLGFLLHKHPEHVHTREFPSGNATVFYPEATEESCTAAVLLDVDPVGMVRLQPAVKCRGREYLRIIYGPEYTLPEHLERLRERGVSGKRSLALREFALGIEGLERFVQREPLRRVHECVFGVLALESEPVDPRL